MPEKHVFVSYAHKDGAVFARRLKRDLENNNVPTWIDELIEPGADWDDQIDHALDQAHTVLVLLTPGATASRQVKGEWNIAIEKDGIKVIPLIIEDCTIPRTLKTYQYLDFRDPTQYAEQFKELLKQLGVPVDSPHIDLPSTGISSLVPPRTDPTAASDSFLSFRNRDEELEHILSTLRRQTEKPFEKSGKSR